MTKVLLIEPERPLMRVMGWVLTEAGFEVIGDPDASHALATVPEIAPDVIVLNGEFPDDERAALIDALHERSASAPVIDVQKMQTWQPLSAREADARVTKPFHAETLVDVIKELVSRDGQAAVSGS